MNTTGVNVIRRPVAVDSTCCALLCGPLSTYDVAMRTITQRQLGQRLAELRKRAGLTQAEVAESLGVVDETLSRLERGTQWTDFEVLIKLCRLYKAEWADLVPAPTGADAAHGAAVQEVVDRLRSCSQSEVELVRGLVDAVIDHRTRLRKRSRR